MLYAFLCCHDDAARPRRGGARRLRPGLALAHTPAEAAHIRLHLDGLMKEGQTPEKKMSQDVGSPKAGSSLV